MRFEEVVDFPYERDAYMFVKGKLNLSEEEYLALSYIERREFANAYKVAKKLGLEKQELLRQKYSDTSMFDKNGNYDLGEAVMIIKAKAAVLSVASKRLGIKDSIYDFVLKGDNETRKVARQVMEWLHGDLSGLLDHIRPLIEAECSFYHDRESRFELQV